MPQVVLDMDFYRSPTWDRNHHSFVINTNNPYRANTWLLAYLVRDKVVTAKPDNLPDSHLLVSPNAMA